jgi:hypothetical protein
MEKIIPPSEPGGIKGLLEEPQVIRFSEGSLCDRLPHRDKAYLPSLVPQKDLLREQLTQERQFALSCLYSK